MGFEITPDKIKVDETLTIIGSSFKPRSKIMIQAKTTDLFGHIWHSSACYRANSKGIVDLSKQAPIKGSYRGIDPMGLVWSMQPQIKDQPQSIFIPAKAENNKLEFNVLHNNEILLSKVIDRHYEETSIKEMDVAEPNVQGRLLLPAGKGLFPAILLLTGSSGGILSQLPMAKLLASRGYAVFICAYFNYGNYSKELYKIPLERFQAGLAWLRQQPSIIPERIVAIAPSKGAEGILAAAAHFNDMNLRGIVAISPSNVVWQGLGKGKPKLLSSWTIKDQALPYLKIASKGILPQFILGTVIKKLKLTRLLPALTRTSFLPIYKTVKKNNAQVHAAQIPVEKINAPLLLIAGNKDKMWPSVYMAQQIVKRRKAKTNPYSSQDELMILNGAGHNIRYPYLPATISWLATPGGKMLINFGGNAQDNAKAEIAAWEKILDFLNRRLKLELNEGM